MNKIELKKIVKVCWVDIVHSSEAEMTEAEALKQKPTMFTSHGLLLVDDKDKITIACSDFVDENGENGYRDVISFPKACIIKVTSVVEVKDAT